MQAVSGKNASKELGKQGEDLAVQFLKKKGYRVLERNYRCRLGEVDLILEQTIRKNAGREENRIIFVEVKTRRKTDSVSPRELISYGKQWHISRVAQNYLASRRLKDTSCDFAVLIVDWSEGSPRFEWIEEAFLLAWGY
jgi:putative endonuclease